MRTEVIKADSIDAAAERILHELKEGSSNSSRSITGGREHVIYFDGWDRLGASAVLRAVAQRLTPGAFEAQAGEVRFDQIIHVDCSKWESRRTLQRAIAEQLDLPAHVMELFDRQDEEDDFLGVSKHSRGEIPQVLEAMYQRIQKLNHTFLVILHNGSSEEMDMSTFGFPLFAYSTNKVLWTFQGRFRLKPRMEVDKAIKTTTGKTDVFLSASRNERDPQELWSVLVHQEVDEIISSGNGNRIITAVGGGIITRSVAAKCVSYILRLSCMRHFFNIDYDLATHSCNYWICEGIIQQGQDDQEDQEQAWRVADAMQHEMRLDLQSLLPPVYTVIMTGESETIPSSSTLTPYLPVPIGAIPNVDMFQHYSEKPISVLKLSRRTISLSSPPFLYYHGLKFLWLDHCEEQEEINTVDTAGKEEDISRFFQRLWVLDVRYTRCERWILSARILGFMTQLRELNVEGAQDWEISQLQGRLPNICKIRVTKSIVRCSNHSKQDLFSGMNKMELLDFSENYTVHGATELSEISTSNSCLQTLVIIDGCVGIPKFSFRGCSKLKNLLFSGLFKDLQILDLSGTAVKTLDLSAMTARSLDELILDNCDKLCAILWPPEGKRKSYLQKLHLDTTQSASTSRSKEEKMKAGSSAATGSPLSWPMVLVNGARAPSEFDWYISIKDLRLLIMSLVPSFENYFGSHTVHLEISSTRCCPTVDVGSSESEGIKNGTGEEPKVMLPNRRRQQPQYYNNVVASMYYADVATTIVEEHLLQGGDEGNGNDDAPTITRTRPCPPPYGGRLDSSDCYLYTQDQQMKTKEGTDGGASIPSIICDRTFILHVHDSLYNTSILAGPSEWYYLFWCRVERCPRLEFIFTAPPLLSGGGSCVYMCLWLRTFWASQLPRARFMWDTSKLPLSQIHSQSFEDLELLHLDFCPRLIHVLPFSSAVWFYGRRLLETIEIVWCGDLRVVFPLLDTNDTRSLQEQQQKPPGAIITIVNFPNLKRIHLHELPMLESICGLGRMYAPKLETIKIRGCWSLRHLPAVNSNRSYNNRVECDCEKEWWDRLEWDGLGGKHHPSLYRTVHSRYYKKKLLRGSVLI